MVDQMKVQKGEGEMRAIDERERRRLEAERRFEEMMKRPCPGTRPRMMAIAVTRAMAHAIQRNPESLKMIAVDPETGATVMARPYAAKGATTVFLGLGVGLGAGVEVYAVVGRS
jgi:hypothetical protein